MWEIPLTNSVCNQNIQNGGLWGGVRVIVSAEKHGFCTKNVKLISSETDFTLFLMMMDDISVRKRHLEDKLAQVFPVEALLIKPFPGTFGGS